MKPNETDHWLVRASTIRRLWIGATVLLTVLVLLQLLIPIKGYFGVDGWFGFGAVFGFVCCLLMVLVAKGLGYVLKRPDTYYQPKDRDTQVTVMTGDSDE